MALDYVKLVVVGDGAVGKTSLLTSFVSGGFPEEHVPTVFDNQRADVMVDDNSVSLDLWDTAGQEDYDNLRPMSYGGSHVVMMCFSLVDASSLSNIRAKWFPEVHQHAAKAAIVLIGTKSDLRKGNGTDVADAAAETIAKEIGAVKFVSCSALTQTNLKEAFHTAVRAAWASSKAAEPPRPPAGGGCCIIL